MDSRGARASAAVFVLAVLSGLAGLNWSILWQHHAALALGVSSEAAAVSLICISGGMAIGAFLAGPRLERVARPLRVYAILEAVIGGCGLLLAPGFSLLARLDQWLYHTLGAAAIATHPVSMLILLGPAAIAMGATIPTFYAVCKRHGGRTSTLYAANTGGAALGALLGAFVLVPRSGIAGATALLVGVNLAVSVVAVWLDRRAPDAAGTDLRRKRLLDIHGWRSKAIVFLTGFVTFALEVAWFRILRACYQSTTDSFALMLFGVLVPAAVGAHLSHYLSSRKRVALVLTVAGCLVLLLAPVVERLDLLLPAVQTYGGRIFQRTLVALFVVGLPILPLSMILPALLDSDVSARDTGKLYGWNTLGSVLGSLLAAWVLLPAFGAVHTTWLAGTVLALSALFIIDRRQLVMVAATVAALLFAFSMQSGVGRLRAQSTHLRARHQVLESHEGPDATVSVVLLGNGQRELVIDGIQASGEGMTMAHYMIWMGRLPMLAHPAPKQALVICFGTGQTAHAVRDEGPDDLDIVELSPAVLAVAEHFRSNHSVLKDPRVEAIRMDGRAWLRRTDRRYDIVTLEPMPPHLAGTNALYSREFYELAASRLNPGGVVAQWVPFHLLPPDDSASVIKTFVAVFPDALLWVDPKDQTGVLLGRTAAVAGAPLDAWPGLARAIPRDLSRAEVANAVALGPAGLAKFAAPGRVITDDNQLLAYGPGARLLRSTQHARRSSAANMERIAHMKASP